MINDVRYALRVLAKHRGFTAVVVFALAIGIGANTAIFSMANAILFHPYPFAELDRIVSLAETIPAVSQERYAVSAGNYFDWKEQCGTFVQMAAYKRWDATVTMPDGPERAHAHLVSPEFFPLLGLAPLQGRFFSPGDVERDPNQIVISYGFWQQRLGRDPHAVGRSLVLNGQSYIIAGIMGKDSDFPMYAEIWAAWIATPVERRGRANHDLEVIARLRPGATLAQAQAETHAIASRLSREYPLSNSGRGVSVMLLRDTVDEYAGKFITVVSSAVLFLLLLACANVANLQLARGTSRQTEMALRLALGARRSRIVRQLLIEGVALSFLGAMLGLPLALWGLAAIRASLPELVARHLPGLSYTGLNASMLTSSLIAAALTGIAFTIPAALQACSQQLHETLKSGGRGSPSSGSRTLRSTLVVSEIVLAVALVIGAGLMLKGFHNLAAPDQGFQPGNVLTFAVTLPESKYRDNSQIVNYYNEILRRLHDIPGLRSAAVISDLPALADSRSSSIQIEGQPAGSPDHPLLAELRVSSEDYFRAFSIPIQAGRSFSNYDTADGPPVAVISQSAAHRFWPGRDPLGRRLKLTSRDSNTPYLTVVGVAADVKHFLLSNEVRPTIYIPYTQQPVRSLEAVIESSGPLDRMAVEARAAVRSVDSTLALPSIQRIARYFSDLVAGVGVIAWLMGIFAVMAALLAAAGIYAVMSYSVAQRTREIGIRMALGARPQDVVKMIVSNALRLVAIGLVIGCLVAFALSRGMSSTLPGVVALDPVTFTALSLLLTAIALLASLVPSRRATKVDPLLALRSD